MSPMTPIEASSVLSCVVQDKWSWWLYRAVCHTAHHIRPNIPLRLSLLSAPPAGLMQVRDLYNAVTAAIKPSFHCHLPRQLRRQTTPEHQNRETIHLLCTRTKSYIWHGPIPAVGVCIDLSTGCLRFRQGPFNRLLSLFLETTERFKASDTGAMTCHDVSTPLTSGRPVSSVGFDSRLPVKAGVLSHGARDRWRRPYDEGSRVTQGKRLSKGREWNYQRRSSWHYPHCNHCG